ACQDLLLEFGGHAMAAGLSIKESNLKAFRRRFVKICEESLAAEDFIPKLAVDAEAVLADITAELIEELSLLEPHGIGNPGPTLAVTASLAACRTIGRDGSHLQLVLQDASAREVAAVAFELGAERESLTKQAESINFAFVPKINEWRNRQTVQLHIKAWQQGPRRGDFIEKWLIDKYPWRLSPPYLISSALTKEGRGGKPAVTPSYLDLRGTWDKVAALEEERSPKEPTLILVNTPLAALQLCRRLRILVPGGSNFIGFQHELLGEDERRELKELRPTWLVSTGYGENLQKWPAAWFWQPPLNQGNFFSWAALVDKGGQIALLYGPKDLRAGQVLIGQVYPDRKGLARIYSTLRVGGGEVDLKDAQDLLGKMGLAAALPFAIGVFSEMGLWEVADGRITYLPVPARKLDLRQTVLYNKGRNQRKQSFDYLKHCLERGFFQDGLEGEN
ncbi:MAG TPA: hypothetical protein GX528_06510, partial [Firmicutes bacterium]|nr:hypothetical protein [Bacillota bacterium]